MHVLLQPPTLKRGGSGEATDIELTNQASSVLVQNVEGTILQRRGRDVEVGNPGLTNEVNFECVLVLLSFFSSIVYHPGYFSPLLFSSYSLPSNQNRYTDTGIENIKAGVDTDTHSTHDRY